MNYETLFLKSLILTILVESVVLVALFRLVIKNEDISIARLLSAAVIASFATLPYLWFVLPTYVDHKLGYVAIGESFAVLMETFIIKVILKIEIRQALISSTVCNLISFLAGLAISWP